MRRHSSSFFAEGSQGAHGPSSSQRLTENLKRQLHLREMEVLYLKQKYESTEKEKRGGGGEFLGSAGPHATALSHASSRRGSGGTGKPQRGKDGGETRDVSIELSCAQKELERAQQREAAVLAARQEEGQRALREEEALRAKCAEDVATAERTAARMQQENEALQRELEHRGALLQERNNAMVSATSHLRQLEANAATTRRENDELEKLVTLEQRTTGALKTEVAQLRGRLKELQEGTLTSLEQKLCTLQEEKAQLKQQCAAAEQEREELRVVAEQLRQRMTAAQSAAATQEQMLRGAEAEAQQLRASVNELRRNATDAEERREHHRTEQDRLQVACALLEARALEAASVASRERDTRLAMESEYRMLADRADQLRREAAASTESFRELEASELKCRAEAQALRELAAKGERERDSLRSTADRLKGELAVAIKHSEAATRQRDDALQAMRTQAMRQREELTELFHQQMRVIGDDAAR